MIKYNIVVCSYDKIFVSVAAYVILQWIIENVIKHNIARKMMNYIDGFDGLALRWHVFTVRYELNFYHNSG